MGINNNAQKPRRHKSVRDYALYCTVVRTIKQSPAYFHGSKGFIILVVPEGFDPEHYGPTAIDILHGDNSLFGRNDVDFFSISTKSKRDKIVDEFVSNYQSKNKLLAFSENHEMIPSVLKLAADTILDLPVISPRDLRAACRIVLGMKLTESQAEQILSYPLDLVWPTLRPNRSGDEVLKRLANASTEVSTKRDADIPPLHDMYGYGAAKLWGLELAQDIRDWQSGKISWSDVDKGIVLSGPPGVGKTIFAKALAQECGTDVIATSLGQWQSNGHLGDLLKAMRRDFNKAKVNAPCLIFVDELDSFGDRKLLTDDHRDYSTQVVNAFLECLDGLDGREGVIVVGATNNITNIDPAILRSGRLDKHVKVPLPDAEARLGILSLQLGGSLSPADLESLKLCTTGMTGADLAKATRDAKRIARRANRTITIVDVEAALPAVIHLDEAHLRANAIHEAGHTIIGLRLGQGTYVGTWLVNQIVSTATTGSGGHAEFSYPPFERRDRTFYADQIAICLAGIAAEALVLGSASDGAGMDDDSDIALATRLATMIEAKMGLGDTLRFSHVDGDKELEQLRQLDHRLRDRIDTVLSEQLDRAKAILQDERALLERLADELVRTGNLTPERVEELENGLQTKKQLMALRSS